MRRSWYLCGVALFRSFGMLGPDTTGTQHFFYKNLYVFSVVMLIVGGVLSALSPLQSDLVFDHWKTGQLPPVEGASLAARGVIGARSKEVVAAKHKLFLGNLFVVVSLVLKAFREGFRFSVLAKAPEADLLPPISPIVMVISSALVQFACSIVICIVYCVRSASSVGGTIGGETAGFVALTTRPVILIPILLSIILAALYDLVQTDLAKRIAPDMFLVIQYLRLLPFFVIGCWLFDDGVTTWQCFGLYLLTLSLMLYFYAARCDRLEKAVDANQQLSPPASQQNKSALPDIVSSVSSTSEGGDLGSTSTASSGTRTGASRRDVEGTTRRSSTHERRHLFQSSGVVAPLIESWNKTAGKRTAEQEKVVCTRPPPVRRSSKAAAVLPNHGEDIDVVPPPASPEQTGNVVDDAPKAENSSPQSSSSLLALVTLFVLVFAFYTMRAMRPNYYSAHLYDTAVAATTDSENTSTSSGTSPRAGTSTTLPASTGAQQVDEGVTPVALFSSVNPKYFFKHDTKVLGELPLPPQSPDGLNPSQLRALYQLFYDLDALLVEKDVDYFAIDGTLLGAVRNKGVIPWDTDGDVGISLADYKKFTELKNELRVRGYGLSEEWWGYEEWWSGVIAPFVSGHGPQQLKVFRLEVDSML